MRHLTRLTLFSVLFSTVCFFAVGSPVQAEELPAHYPKSFGWTVPIDAIDYRNRVLIAGDIEMQLADDAVIHSPSRKNDTIFSLRPGRVIGFASSTPDLPLGEVWIVPTDALRKLHSE